MAAAPRCSRSATILALDIVWCVALVIQANGAEKVVKLSPSAFPQLPVRLAAALERLGCTIPQHAESGKRGNVIKGEFSRPGQMDWAVLCTRPGYLELYVFRNGQPTNRAVVWSLRVPEPLPGPFETEIAPVGRDYILEHCRAEGAEAPPIDHQGIGASTGMSGGISYLYRGKWLVLPGAD
jgi:hypothetical protein